MAIPCCGPKMSLCCTIVSVWGVIMLTLMGVFLRMKSPAFIEDLPIDETEWPTLPDGTKDPSYVYGKYDQASTNCFIAAGLYVATFVVSVVALRINNNSSYVTT